MNNVRVFLLCATCVFINAFAFSQGEQPNTERNNTFMSSWNVVAVGVHSDNFEAMSGAVRKTALFLNSMVDYAIKAVSKRVMNAEETVKAKEFLRTKALASLEKTLSETIIKQESAVLVDDKKEEWTTRSKEKKTIDELTKKIKKIKALKVAEIPIKTVLPIKFIEESKYISIKPTQDIHTIAQELSVQSVLYFTLDEIEDGYIIIELYAYNAILRQKQRVLRTILHEEKIALIQDALQVAINTYLLGSPAASLRIEVVVDSEEETWRRRVQDAPILMDGDVVGFGFADLPVINTGNHTVMVHFEGQQRTIVVKLNEGDDAVRRVLFNANAENTLTLMSDPAGARVYVNSQWLGNTPLVLSRPVGNIADQVEVRLVDHEHARLTINSVAPASMSVKLKSIYAVPLKTRLKQRRNRFYTAFAVFGVSLIPPIILNSLYTGENAALVAESKRQKLSHVALLEADNRRQAYFYSYVGTSVLAAGMSVYALVELIFYLRTAGEYHDR